MEIVSLLNIIVLFSGLGRLIDVVCERYTLLPNDKKQMIAGELDRSVREIERKISVSSP